MNKAYARKLYHDKQLEVLWKHFTTDYFIMVNHGAVRTGKTIVDNDIFLSELRRTGKHAANHRIKDPQFILAGASLGAIRRNILNPLIQKYGIDFKFDNVNRFKLFGTQVCCFGHDDIGNLSTVTGMTSYGAYLNEATKGNDEVVKQIVKRCSGDAFFNPKIVMDTNPDAPIHPIKVDYIDKADGKRIIENRFTLDDNTFLSQKYVEDLKAATPSGVFTDRDINGLWVTADGVVYLDYDEKVHLVDTLPAKSEIIRYFAGVDWGYEHFGVIVLIAETKDALYLVEEIAVRHQLTDWWVLQAQKLIERYGHNIPFYCDTASPERIQMFRNGGIWTLNANKSVVAGIETVASYLKRKKLFFHKEVFKEGRKQMYSYVWDKKGEPVKVDDDVPDAIRYAIHTDKGKERIYAQ